MLTLKKCAADTPRNTQAAYKNTHDNETRTKPRLAQTPASNTGLNSQERFTAAIDWLDITFRSVQATSEIHAIIGEVEALTGDAIDFSTVRPVYNGKKWDGHGRGAKGTQVFYSGPSLDDEGKMVEPALKIVMSGSVVGEAHQAAIALWLEGRWQKNDGDCTRVDIALDDHDKSVKLWKITEARKAGNFFNASESAYLESGKRGHDIGRTIYFGSTKSDKRLCIYDKTIESKGKILGNRWEARFRRKAAREAVQQWMVASNESEQKVCKWYADTVTGIIDFRDRSGNDPNRNRCKRLLWFQSFVTTLRSNPCRVRVPSPVQTLQKTIKWIGKSVAPSIAILRRVLGDEFPKYLDSMIDEGGEKISMMRRKIADTTDPGLLVW